ncbi:MAG: hypothetical protein HYU66_20235, partial [Armatimonadetes bacterium]|nr:hypothetical protein [Armatimonadota bacterium]
MLVLHLGDHDGRLWLWAESDRPAPSSDDGGGPAYPFAAERKALTQALAAAGIALKPTAKAATSLTLWLPTRGAHPIPSTPLIGAAPGGRSKVQPRPWRLTAWPLALDAALDLLALAGDRHTLAPGVIAGVELAWWAAAAQLAGSLVVRGQYLPGLVVEEVARAVWEP